MLHSADTVSIVSPIMNMLLGSYLSLHAFYWGGCLLLGSPLAQPTLKTVYSQARIAICGDDTHLTTKSSWRRVQMRDCALHLLVWRPLFGTLLHIDQLLLSGWYNNQQIVQPMFVISAPRSGSTSLGHLLDCDEQLCGPPCLFPLCPFLSVWMLVNATVGRFVSLESFSQWALPYVMTEEFRVRHEFDLSKPDTFDVAFAMKQWQGQAYVHSPGPYPENVHTRMLHRDLSEEEQMRAVGFVDEVAKKWLWWCGAGAAGKHLLIKMHAVTMTHDIAAKYPDAAIVSVMREPVQMITSMVPFAGGIADESGAFAKAPQSDWYNAMMIGYYEAYCAAELELLQQGIMLGLPFKTLITDTSVAMQLVNDFRARKWGTAKEQYTGSNHESNVQAERNKAAEIEVTKWRKSLKPMYPSQKVEVLKDLAANAVRRLGMRDIDVDKSSSFTRYRKEMTRFETGC